MSLLVAGSLHLDVVLTAPHLPRLDETVTGSDVAYVFGGKGGNQALAACRMGAQVGFVGRAGSDRFGDMIRDTLASSALDLTQMQRDAGPSGMSAAIVDADGNYGAVIVSAANLNIEAHLVHVPKGTSLVVLQNEIPEAVNLTIAQKAKAAGAQVWLNAAPARPLSPDFLRTLDLLIVNRVEAAFYDALPPELEVLTTLGADGVAYQGQVFAGHRVAVVSTHGAGDMFVGALAARVDQGDDLATAIAFAQTAAALHVSSETTDRQTLTPTSVATFLAG